MSLAEDFATLFAGRTDAIGLGRGGVVRGPVTLAHYEQHLAGIGDGIGIFPMLDSNECRFGAIDLDEPNFELARALQRLLPKPTWVERSRSGNAHVWAFFDRPAPAWAVRAVFRFALEALGRTDVEIFPKQDELRPGMVGNYINLPYHGNERPVLLEDDTQLLPDGFIAAALAARHDPDAWVRRARQVGGQPPAEREPTAEWGESPVLHECAAYILEHRHDNPLRPGHRASVIFNVSKQLLNYRDMTEREARELIHELNEAGVRPVPRHEVDRQFNNARDSRMTSTGCDDPLMADYVSPDCPIAQGRLGRA